MPKGELYIKYQSGMSVTNSNRYKKNNDGTFTQNNSGSWIDAFDEWGVSLDSTAIAALMTPAPLKSMIENDVYTEHGRQVVSSGRKYDSRTFSLNFNITAPSEATFLTRYDAFCTNVLALGRFILLTKYQLNKMYRLDYLSCQNFSQYQREIGKFSLRVLEANPNSRTVL